MRRIVDFLNRTRQRINARVAVGAGVLAVGSVAAWQGVSYFGGGKAEPKGPTKQIATGLLANLDPTTREIQQSRMLADRLTVYLKRAPILLAWELDWIAAKLAAQPEVVGVLANLNRYGEAAGKVAGAAESLPGELRQTLAEERRAIFEDLGAERRAIFEELGKEREAFFRELDAQSRAVLAHAGKLVAGCFPEVRDRLLVPDQHARP